jgi:hypothetical protein
VTTVEFVKASHIEIIPSAKLFNTPSFLSPNTAGSLLAPILVSDYRRVCKSITY